MICVLCGQQSKEPMCDLCFAKKNELFTIASFPINICKVCEKSTDVRGVRSVNEQRPLDDLINKEIKSKNKILDVKIKSKKIGNKIYAEIAVNGRFVDRNVKKTETKKILISVTDKTCDNQGDPNCTFISNAGTCSG